MCLSIVRFAEELVVRSDSVHSRDGARGESSPCGPRNEEHVPDALESEQEVPGDDIHARGRWKRSHCTHTVCRLMTEY